MVCLQVHVSCLLWPPVLRILLQTDRRITRIQRRFHTSSSTEAALSWCAQRCMSPVSFGHPFCERSGAAWLELASSRLSSGPSVALSAPSEKKKEKNKNNNQHTHTHTQTQRWDEISPAAAWLELASSRLSSGPSVALSASTKKRKKRMA